jgi:hypothetical protein
MVERQRCSRFLVPLWASLLLMAGGTATAQDPVDARMRKDITFLASDQCEGRGVATHGINLAADYIANEFKKAGLQPGGPDHSYFQPFTMGGGVLESPNTLSFRGPRGEGKLSDASASQGGQPIRLRLGDDFEPLGFAHSGKVSAPLVFAGYGITTESYDDYQNLDVAGRIVMVLRGIPQNDESVRSSYDRTRWPSFTAKIQNAKEHGALAVLFVNNHKMAQDGDAPLRFSYMATAGSPANMPSLHLRRAVVDDVLKASLGSDLDALEKSIADHARPASAALAGWTADLQVSVNRSGLSVKNVVGVLEGAGPLSKETVVIGAHYDHLGYGGPGSLAGLAKPAIHHGADDNGSGTTTLMELARRFGGIPNRQGRRLVFIAFSGEESGLLGSEHYCKHPLYSLAETVAMVNMDMVGRLRKDKKGPWSALLAMLTPEMDGAPPVILSAAALSKGTPTALLTSRDKMTVYGTGTSPGFARLLDDLNERYGFRLQKGSAIFGDSDHASFYAKKIPVFFFFTDDHEDYHRPSDTSDKINVSGMHRIADLVQDLVTNLATAPDRPQFVKVSSQRSDPGRFSGMPRLGFRPGNYGEEDGGVLVGGVLDGGAAAKGGIKEGDRIVSIGGKTVKNMTAYMSVMSAQKKGKPLEISLQRGGQTLTVTVTPD